MIPSRGKQILQPLLYSLWRNIRICSLQVTKWVHLNHGDAGVKLLFRKVFKMLRPGGLFILESQVSQARD